MNIGIGEYTLYIHQPIFILYNCVRDQKNNKNFGAIMGKTRSKAVDFIV